MRHVMAACQIKLTVWRRQIGKLLLLECWQLPEIMRSFMQKVRFGHCKIWSSALTYLYLTALRHIPPIVGKSSTMVLTIPWVTDGGPDGAKARKLLGIRKPRIIMIHCWGHQIGLTVGDYMELDLPFLDSIPEALEIIKWFNNHSMALEWFNQQQRFNLGKSLTLISPVVSCWTAYYLILSRLKAVENPLRICCIDKRQQLIENGGNVTANTVVQKNKALSILGSVNSDEFWYNIEL